MQELNVNLDGLEKCVRRGERDVADVGREREFYLGKLREIEILVSARLEAVPPPPKEESDTLLQVQAVLYATEEGFEIPQDEEGAIAAEEEVF